MFIIIIKQVHYVLEYTVIQGFEFEGALLDTATDFLFILWLNFNFTRDVDYFFPSFFFFFFWGGGGGGYLLPLPLVGIYYFFAGMC